MLSQYHEKLKNRVRETTLQRYYQTAQKFTIEQGINRKEDLTIENFYAFLDRLKERGFKESYILSSFYALKRFYAFYGIKIEDKPPEKGHPRQPIITEEQAKGLLELSKRDLSHHLIFRLLLETAIRRIEITMLKVENFDKGMLFIPTAKRGNARHIQLGKDTALYLVEYIKGKQKKEQLFPYTERDLNRIFRRYAHKMGINKGVGLHSIRRSLVTWYHNKGVSEVEIQKFMGWKTSSMVSVYVQLNQKELNDKMRRLNPIL